jgi:hypothetical protein
MKRTKFPIMAGLIILVNLLLLEMTLSQQKEGDRFFQSGIVKEMTSDRKAIIVNGKKFFIHSDTQIVDHKGNKLKMEDIKHNIDVAIDAVTYSNGYLIKKIVIITDRGV